MDASDGHQPSEECHIKGLTKASKYLIVVQAFNNRGSSPASEEIVVQTSEKGEALCYLLFIIVRAHINFREHFSGCATNNIASLILIVSSFKVESKYQLWLSFIGGTGN